MARHAESDRLFRTSTGMTTEEMRDVVRILRETGNLHALAFNIDDLGKQCSTEDIQALICGRYFYEAKKAADHLPPSERLQILESLLSQGACREAAGRQDSSITDTTLELCHKDKLLPKITLFCFFGMPRQIFGLKIPWKVIVLVF